MRLYRVHFLPLLLLAVLVAGGCEKKDYASKNGSKAKSKTASKTSGKASSTAKHNVVMITLSGLRTDRCGAYGGDAGIMPFLNSFAEESIVFEKAYAQESYPLASVASILSANYPIHHKALYTTPEPTAIAEDAPMLAEVLAAKGYTCSAIVTGDQMASRVAFRRGFKPYVYLHETASSQPAANAASPASTRPALKISNSGEMLLENLQKLVKKKVPKPLFLYLQFSETQMPVAPPAPFNTKFASPEAKAEIENAYAAQQMPVLNGKNTAVATALYDGAAAYMDNCLKQAVEYLESKGYTRKNTIFVILSDHGEELCDKHQKYPLGYGCARSLYDEQIRVPLMMSIPGLEKKVSQTDALVELVDVAPTIVDVLDLSWGKGKKIDGKSMLPMLKDEAKHRTIIYSGGNHGRAALINGNFKYIVGDQLLRKNRQSVYNAAELAQPQAFEELYNLKIDARELRNVITAEKNRQALEKMKDMLKAKLDGKKVPSSKPVKSTSEE